MTQNVKCKKRHRVKQQFYLCIFVQKTLEMQTQTLLHLKLCFAFAEHLLKVSAIFLTPTFSRRVCCMERADDWLVSYSASQSYLLCACVCACVQAFVSGPQALCEHEKWTGRYQFQFLVCSIWFLRVSICACGDHFRHNVEKRASTLGLVMYLEHDTFWLEQNLYFRLLTIIPHV